MKEEFFLRKNPLTRKIEAVEKRDLSITKKEEELGKMKQKVDELEQKRQQELERISGFNLRTGKRISIKDC